MTQNDSGTAVFLLRECYQFLIDVVICFLEQNTNECTTPFCPGWNAIASISKEPPNFWQ